MLYYVKNNPTYLLYGRSSLGHRYQLTWPHPDVMNNDLNRHTV